MSRHANINTVGSNAATAAMELPRRQTPVDGIALAARCMR
jgi:hypothetical protein